MSFMDRKIWAAFIFGAFIIFGLAQAPAQAEWPHVASSIAGGHYSDLTDITPENVNDLELAWEHRSGDFNEGGNFRHGIDPDGGRIQSGLQVTPIMFDDRVYYCTPYNRVFAIDPETGEEIWVFDPEIKLSDHPFPRCRGVSSYVSSSIPEGQACHKQVIAPTVDARIFSLDAATGVPCANFGKGGHLDLSDGLGDHLPFEYMISSPPVIVGDLLVSGAAVLDNISVDVPSGVVRAYDMRNGTMLWAWEALPPGTKPALNPETKEQYQRGTTNVWSFISADPELGLVYVPTGNTSPDYYGGHRDGSDYYSASVVALEMKTGKVRWHFQMVHHDIWDYDTPSQPMLIDVERDGRVVKALAQSTKMGYIFILDRETGEPVFPVEERPVPQGAVAGDFTAATQPFPTLPPSLTDDHLTEDEVWGLTPVDRYMCQRQLREYRNEGLFTPPSEEGSIHYPGAFGGQNWGGPAVDPVRGKLIVNTLHVASIVKMIPREQCGQAEKDRRASRSDSKMSNIEPSAGTPYCDHRWLSFNSPLGVPCSPPPWGTLASIDVASGQIDWQVPLGTTRDLAPWPFWYIKGVPNSGGPIVTASGLVFIGATTDYYLRAFSTANGEELWKVRLPTAAHASPMSYRGPRSGRQFIVIAAGGSPALGTPPGDHIMAFALPETAKQE